MSVVMDNGAVDGYALVSDLLAALGLTPNRVTRILVEPCEVIINYLMVNEDGKPYSTEGGLIAESTVVLPMNWTRKP